MAKVKYLIKRILSMHYKQMFEKIGDIHRKTGRSRIILFFDVIWCGLVYQAGYMDYWLFEMYDLNRAQRKTIVTRSKNNEFIKRFNDPAYMPEIENKLKFAKNFGEYMHRDWLDMTTATREEFDAFVKKHPTFMSKPVDGMCGKGIEKINAEAEGEGLYDRLRSADARILEDYVYQHERLMQLYPGAVNTCRIVSLTVNGVTKIVAAYLRIGNGGIVDNFNSGGMVVPIEVDSGEIVYPALDKKGNLYETHPMTGTAIKGFVIPKWDEVGELIRTVGGIVPQVGLVGWDVCVTDNGPLLIEANDYPGHDIYQLPPHRKDGIGMLPRFNAVIDELCH